MIETSAPPPQSSAQSATAATPSDRRRHSRHRVSWPARLSLDGVDYRQVTVEDVSDGGFGLSRVTDRLARLQPVWIWLDGIGAFACEARWQSGDRLGVMLLHDAACLSDDEISALSTALTSPPVRR